MRKPNTHTNRGFRIPQNYLENFENKLLERLDQQDGLTLVLSKNNANSGFKVPNQYFDQLEARVLETNSPPKNSTKVISWPKWRILSGAASIAAIFVLFFSTLTKGSKSAMNTDSIALYSLENYIHDHMDFSILELEDYFYAADHVYSEMYSEGLETEMIYHYLEENLEDPIENELFLTE